MFKKIGSCVQLSCSDLLRSISWSYPLALSIRLYRILAAVFHPSARSSQVADSDSLRLHRVRNALAGCTVYQLASQTGRRALVECADKAAAADLLKTPRADLSGNDVQLVSIAGGALNDLSPNERLLCAILDPEPSSQLLVAPRRKLETPHALHNRVFDKYAASEEVFKSLCDTLNFIDGAKGPKVPLATVHATPGVGKSALLDQLVYCVLEQQKRDRGEPCDQTALALLANAKRWPQRSVVTTLTFNHQSPYQCVN